MKMTTPTISAALLCLTISPVVMSETNKTVCYPDQPSHIIYVDSKATGNGDGSSWQHAYTQLDNALNLAATTPAPAQIWLAAGDYPTPQQGYQLTDNLAIFGGFAGNEQHLWQRRGQGQTRLTGYQGEQQNSPIFFADTVNHVHLAGLTLTDSKLAGQPLNRDRSRDNNTQGSGILAYDSQLSLCDLTVTNNQSQMFGGAIFAQGGEITIAHSRFNNNRVLRGDDEVHDSADEADTDGGAVAVHDSEQVNIVHSSFVNNTAGDDGGALAIRFSNVNITHSEFSHNRAMGAILSSRLPSTTDDFITGFGGAFAIHNEYQGRDQGDQSRTVRISHSTFAYNQSGIGGAGFILAAPGSETTINHSLFEFNGGDGVVQQQPANALGIRYGRGAGALLLVGSRAGDRETNDQGQFVRPLHHLRISDSQFNHNQASYAGALTLISLNSDIDQSHFSHNLGRSRAGAIWNQNLFGLFDQFQGLTPDLGQTTISHSGFYHNRTLGQPENTQALVFAGVATEAEQTYGGGAVSNDLAGRLTVNSSTFYGNQSVNSDGGAIHNATTPMVAFAQANAAKTYPGRLEVNNSVFIQNYSQGSGSGGAIANGGNRRNGELLGADGSDLALTATGADSQVNNSLFYANRAADNGGALFNVNGSQLHSHGNVFGFNRATVGGAIATIGQAENEAQCQIDNSQFYANRAVEEPAIFSQHSQMGLTNNTIR